MQSQSWEVGGYLRALICSVMWFIFSVAAWTAGRLVWRLHERVAGEQRCIVAAASETTLSTMYILRKSALEQLKQDCLPPTACATGSCQGDLSWCCFSTTWRGSARR